MVTIRTDRDVWAGRDMRRTESTAELRAGNRRRIYRISRVAALRLRDGRASVSLWLGKPPRGMAYAIETGRIDGAYLTVRLDGLPAITEWRGVLSIDNGELRADMTGPAWMGDRRYLCAGIAIRIIGHEELWLPYTPILQCARSTSPKMGE